MVTYFSAHRFVTFAAIFLLSFAVRFSILVRVPREQMLSTGEPTRIANALASKGQFADPYVIPTAPTAHTTPFFPVLLAGIYKIFGNGYGGNLVRCLLVISSYSALYALYPTFASALGFPFVAGLIAGFASALVPVKRSAEVFRGWEEPYAALALALLLFLTLKRWNSPRRDVAGAIWLGMGWGAALYISFSLLSVLVGLLIVDLVSNRTEMATRDVCITLVIAMAVTSPWLLRNHRQLQGWTLMRGNLGLELKFANHDHAEPSSTLLNADPTSWSLHPSNSQIEARLVRDLGELEYERRQLHAALAWIAGHPRDFLRLSMEHFFYFWFGPREHPYELIVTSCYTLLGFAGLGLVRKQLGETQFRLYCVVFLSYPLVYYCVDYVNRYRVPIDWLIWLSAGLVVSAMMQKKMRVHDNPSGEPQSRDAEETTAGRLLFPLRPRCVHLSE